MSKLIYITQIASSTKQPIKIKRSLTALSLGTINKSVTKKVTPSTLGAINKLKHLVKIKLI